MDAGGFNFGVDPQELVLLLTSFAAQHEFFEILASSGTTLGVIALTFGLIGFVSLLLLPANWTAGVVGPWLFLMIVLFARPLGEPFFFSDPIETTNDIMNQPLCSGGVIDQDQCAELVSSGSGMTLGDAIEAKARGGIGRVESSFKMFSPIAVVLHVINSLHEGLITELQGFGSRSIDKHIVAIETVRRSVSANNFATYAVANFQAVCGAKNQNFARYASTPHLRLLEKNEEIVTAMRNTPLTVLDGILLFNNFTSFKDRGEGFAPSLICASGAEKPCATDNLYDLTPSHERAVGDLNLLFGPHSILYQSPADFERLLDVADPSATSPAVAATGMSGVDEAIFNLKEKTYKDLKDPFDAFKRQEASILMPTNARAILTSRYADIEDFSDDISDLAKEIDEVAQSWQVKLTGTLTGAAAAGGAAIIGIAICTIITGGTCGIIAGVLTALGSVIAGVVTVNMVETSETRARTISLEERVVDLSSRGVVAAVNNCAEMHRFTDMQLAVSTIQFSYARKELSEFLKDNQDLLKEKEGDLMGLPARERMDILLKSVEERNLKECEDLGGGYGGFTQEDCREATVAHLSQLQAILRTESVRQSSAAAAAFLDNANETQFGGAGFRFASSVGEAVGPFGIWFKTLLGGFGAGTYSAIMPVLVSYASAMIIIMTPLLFMIGLAVPTWSMGVILLPIVVVGYFQLTKVIFSMIGIISGVFIAARNDNLVTGLTSAFSDLIIGTAYTASFLVTGIILFALKNPFGAVQQVAGGADQASTISSQEALQIAGLAFVAGKIPGKVMDAGEKTQTGLGKVAAVTDRGGEKGSVFDSLLSDKGKIVKGEVHQQKAEKRTQAQYHSEQQKEDYYSRASGKLIKVQDSEMVEQLTGNGNQKLVKAAPTGYQEVNGITVPVTGLDNALDSLEAAAKRAGTSLDTGSLTRSKTRGISQVDKDSLAADGTVANIFKVDALKQDGKMDVEALVKSGNATYTDSSKQEIRVVEHYGYSHSGGGGSAASFGPGGAPKSGGSATTTVARPPAPSTTPASTPPAATPAPASGSTASGSEKSPIIVVDKYGNEKPDED